MDTVTITLNGREVSGSSGATILELARQIGISIPTLCHHPLLRNAGACRVCLVEEVKSGRVVASCVTPISDGMDIRTDSEVAFRARRGVLELILSDHPSACVVCDKGNECILRTLAKDHGICDPDLPPIRHWRPLQEVNPFIVRDLTKCVMCGRCIRMCKDFEAVGAIEYMDRGYASHPGTARRTPLEGSECNFCGSCVAICPTDALAERDRVNRSSGKEVSSAICAYCGTGCHLAYDLINGKPVDVRGVPNTGVNSLSLCVRGRYGHDALTSHSRLTDCLIRNDEGEYKSASWNEALNVSISRLLEIKDQYGASSIGLIVGSYCSNEELYLASRLAREILGTPNVDSTARLSSATLVDGIEASFGTFRTGGSVESILKAHTILLLGARPDYTHPVIARNVRYAVRNNDAALIQIDPLTTELSRFARIRLKSGNDELPYILCQLMRVLVDEKLHDESFFLSHVLNPLEFIENISSFESDIDNKVRQAARLIAKERQTMFILGSGPARSAQGYMLTRLALNLPLLIGQPNNVLSLFQGCNELGIWEMGCSSDRLPGSTLIQESDPSQIIKKIWGQNPAVDSGMNSVDMLHAVEKGDLKAILLLGVDPLAVFPNVERTRNALSNAELFVRVGLFPALEEELADVVFPSTSVPEQEGTYINTEGRVQRVTPAYLAPESARSISSFLQDMASQFGSPWNYSGPEAIFQDLCSICPDWDALTWDQVRDPGGVKLPYQQNGLPIEGGPKKPRMVPYTFPQSLLKTDGDPSKHNANGKWRVYPEEQVVYPGDAVVSRHSRRLSAFMPRQVVRMHPQDAEKISVKQGTSVLLSSNVGEVKARIAFDSEVPLSGVVIPIGGPDLLLSRLLDWPEEGYAPGWDTLFVSIKPLEEE